MPCSLRGLAVLGSLLALGAACSDEGNQADDDFLGPMTQDIVGASGASASIRDGSAPLDGGAAIDGSTGPDLGGSGDGGTKADTSQGSGREPPVPTCIPYCTGASCGSPDGCGGYCMMACDCVPSCNPDDCWTSDGCGGICYAGCLDG